MMLRAQPSSATAASTTGYSTATGYNPQAYSQYSAYPQQTYSTVPQQGYTAQSYYSQMPSAYGYSYAQPTAAYSQYPAQQMQGYMMPTASTTPQGPLFAPGKYHYDNSHCILICVLLKLLKVC